MPLNNTRNAAELTQLTRELAQHNSLSSNTRKINFIPPSERACLSPFSDGSINGQHTNECEPILRNNVDGLLVDTYNNNLSSPAALVDNRRLLTHRARSCPNMIFGAQSLEDARRMISEDENSWYEVPSYSSNVHCPPVPRRSSISHWPLSNSSQQVSSSAPCFPPSKIFPSF
jgi:hypothetical protein